MSSDLPCGKWYFEKLVRLRQHTSCRCLDFANCIIGKGAYFGNVYSDSIMY